MATQHQVISVWGLGDTANMTLFGSKFEPIVPTSLVHGSLYCQAQYWFYCVFGHLVCWNTIVPLANEDNMLEADSQFLA